MTSPEDTRDIMASLPLFSTAEEPATAPTLRHPAAAHLAAAGRKPAVDAAPVAVQHPAPADPTPQHQELPAVDDDAMMRLLNSKVVDERHARQNEETRENQTALGNDIIAKVLTNYQDQRVRSGVERLTAAQIAGLHRRLFDEAYRMGALQPILDDVTVENVHVNGAGQVIVRRANGIAEELHPFAETDEELVDIVRSWIDKAGEGAREWNSQSPILRMTLPTPEGERLTAWLPPVSTVPTLRIRCHRIRNIRLDDLVRLDMLTQEAADFLSALVKARQSIVTSGHPGAGKTSFTRGLASCFDPDEPVVTIETERELMLGAPQHNNVLALQARPGQGERDSSGRMIGEITLDELTDSSLRADAQRIIVGEVKGPETIPMFLAMASAAGSMTTIHAEDAQDAMSKLAALQQKELGTSDVFAHRQIIDHIRIIVQLSTFTGAGAPRHVTQIVEVQRGEGDKPVAHELFKSPALGAAAVPVPHGRPSDKLSDVLRDFGYDVNRIWGGSLG